MGFLLLIGACLRLVRLYLGRADEALEVPGLDEVILANARGSEPPVPDVADNRLNAYVKHLEASAAVYVLIIPPPAFLGWDHRGFSVAPS